MKKLMWSGMALIAVLALTALSNGAGQAPEASAAGTVTAVSIDTNTTGNTANAVGTVENCIQVANGATFEIDVVMVGLPTGERLAGVSYDIDYDGAIVQLGNDDDTDNKFDEDTQALDGDEDGDGASGEEGPDTGATIGHDTNFVLTGATDFSKGNGNDTTTWSDFSYTFFKLSGFPIGPRSGVLNRITVEAVGNGVTTLNLRDLYDAGGANSAPGLLDNNTVRFTIGNGSTGDAKIAVGQPCPALVLVQGNVDCSPAPEVSAVDALKVLRNVTGLPVTKVDPACPDIGAGSFPVWGNVDCSLAAAPPEVSAVDALKILRHVTGLSVTQTEPCVNIGATFP